MIKLARITMAVNNVDEMVAFYNAVLETGLKPIPAFGDIFFHAGKLAGHDLLMCPNTIAGVDAKQNRQQLKFIVGDIEATLRQVAANGGEIKDDIQETPEGKMAAIIDPDGNTIEIVQS